MSVLNNSVLVLNKGWMPIDVTNVYDAVLKVCRDDPVAKFVDPETYVTYDFESWVETWEDAIRAAKFDAEKVLESPCLAFRLPEVIVLNKYDGDGQGRKSNRAPKFSRRNVYLRDRNTCFAAGTLVLMADGRQVPIENVRKGDRVIDAYGKPQTVAATGSRWVDESLVVLRRGSAMRTTVTPEHPFLSSSKEFKAIGEWEVVDGRQRGGGDYMVFPRFVSYEVDDCGFVDVSEWLSDRWFRYREGRIYRTRRPHEQGVPAVVRTSDELSMLLGLYCAEGSSSKVGCVSFSYCMDERDILAEQTKKLLLDILGLESTIDEMPERDTCVVRVGSKTLASILKRACGKNSHNKKAPWKWIGKHRIPFLRGLILGDGYIRDDKAVLSMASEQMVLDAQSISWGLGMFPTLQACQRPDGRRCWTLVYQGENFSELMRLVLDGDAPAGRRIFGDDDFVYFKLQDKDTGNGALVYNIEVDATHSYIANGVSVHNCQYCGRRCVTEESNLDHVIPKSKGGGMTWRNIVVACVTCNDKKKNRTPEEAGMRLVRKPRVPKPGELKRPWGDKLKRKLRGRVLPSWEHFLGKMYDDVISEMYWNVELREGRK